MTAATGVGSGSDLCALGQLHDATECPAVADREVGQDLAVDLDLRLLETGDELPVRQPVLAGGRIDPDDPQLAHLALSLLAVAGRVGERVQQRLAGGLDQLRLGALSALGRLEQALVALVRGDASLDSCHVSLRAPRGTGAGGGPAVRGRAGSGPCRRTGASVETT